MGILTEDMQRTVREQRLGYMATVCPDGTPNLSPKGTIRVWDDDHLVFGEICSPGTMENLAHNPTIEINVCDTFLRKGYRFKGTAEVLTEGNQFEKIMELYLGTASQPGIGSQIRSIVLITVQRALPVVSPGYSPGISESQMKAQWKDYYVSLAQP